MILLLVGWRGEVEHDGRRADNVIERYATQPDLVPFGAVVEGCLVGMICIGVAERGGVIHQVVVDPGWRRRGIGQIMIAQAIARLDLVRPNVARLYYTHDVSVRTVRLANDDEQLLDKLATSFGGRSNAIRLALRSLAGDVDRHEALGAFLAEWEVEAGPVDEAQVDALSRRYKL